MNSRENMLRAIRFERPEYIPVQFCINESVYYAYPAEAMTYLCNTVVEAMRFLQMGKE